MCGIVGSFHFSSSQAVDSQLIARMNQAQYHRGPDESGEYINGPVGFGHRRLSIIDVSSGQQPMLSPDDNIALIFNGEIYNYVELRQSLIELGHQFTTDSDTEVILHAYMEWQQECVNKLRGMFTFAIWDMPRKQLFLARDRLGIKPLYYTINNGKLHFSSELKSLVLIPDVPKTLSDRAIEQYFALGYTAEPDTIYQNIHKLPPAHTLTISHHDLQPNIECYWDVSYAHTQNITEEEAIKQLNEQFTQATSSHLVSEVPLGSFLSGGVDSSGVVAHMDKLSSSKTITCSIGFDVKNYNETEFAQKVVDRYKTTHHIEQVSSQDIDMVENLANLYDEPYADSSAMPTYRVCELARKHVTVCLSGDGADELLAGYRRYRLFMNEEKIRQKIPKKIRSTVFKPLGQLYPKLDMAPQFLRAKSTFQSLALSTVEGYFRGISLLKDEQRDALFSDELKQRLHGYNAVQVFTEHEKNFDGTDPLQLLQYIDLKTYLVGDILTKVDRASMANSLEVRVPFLDHKFVEWSATIPSQLKLKQGEGKYILKKALEPYLPHDILYRQKMGFRVPLAEWFRGPLKETVRQRLLSIELTNSGLFKLETIKLWLDEHQSGLRDHSTALWTLLMFESFYRQQVLTLQDAA